MLGTRGTTKRRFRGMGRSIMPPHVGLHCEGPPHTHRRRRRPTRQPLPRQRPSAAAHARAVHVQPPTLPTLPPHLTPRPSHFVVSLHITAACPAGVGGSRRNHTGRSTATHAAMCAMAGL